jgi:hypothetical protein
MSGTYLLVLPSSTVQFRRILKFLNDPIPLNFLFQNKSESKRIESKSDMLKMKIRIRI